MYEGIIFMILLMLVFILLSFCWGFFNRVYLMLFMWAIVLFVAVILFGAKGAKMLRSVVVGISHSCNNFKR